MKKQRRFEDIGWPEFILMCAFFGAAAGAFFWMIRQAGPAMGAFK